MDKLKYLYAGLVVSLILFVILMRRNLENGSNVHVFHRSSSRSLTNRQKGHSESQLDIDIELEGLSGVERKYEWKTHTSPIPLELILRQYTRKKLLHDLCSNNGTFGLSGEWNRIDDVPKWGLNHLYVDDRHGIIYCSVPRVGSTALKRIMIVLSESLKVNGIPYRDSSDIPLELIHERFLYSLNRNSLEVMKEKLKNYKKFIFVRDPFVRLISAYRGNVENETQAYQNLAPHIQRKYSNKNAEVPSFSQFIQFILGKPDAIYIKNMDLWRSISQLCHPCLIDYDFIGKMETMEEDAAHLLRILHVDNIAHLQPSSTKMVQQSWLKTWFTNIPADWRRKLYKMYDADFKLFGYQNFEELLQSLDASPVYSFW